MYHVVAKETLLQLIILTIDSKKQLHYIKKRYGYLYFNIHNMLILNINIFQMQYKITYSIKHCVELFWINPIFLIILMIFVCCLFVVYHPTREFSTHMETSPLWAKGCKFWPMLGTRCYWALNVPRLLWHGPKLCNGHLRPPVSDYLF